MPDETLVTMAQGVGKDASEAMNYLMEKHKEMVRVKTRPYFLLGAERTDLIQEGMIGLFKAVISYNTEKNNSFRAYAELLVHRQIVTAVKLAARQKHMPLNDYISLNAPVRDEEDNETTMLEMLTEPGAFTPEDTVINTEQIGRLQSEIEKKLSKYEQRVLSLYLAGNDYHRIAQALGKTPKSIDNALQRIKKKVGQIAAEL